MEGLVGEPGRFEMHLSPSGLQCVEREADGQDGDGQIVHLTEHGHDARDEVDR